MSRAREIAEERFAKGEISREDYQEIVSNFSSQKNSDPIPETTTKTKRIKIWYIAVGAVTLAFVVFKFLPTRTTGLKAGQFSSIDGNVKFTIANQLDQSGDVVSWFIVDRKVFCERVFKMKSHGLLKIVIDCPQLPAGDFKHGYGWAVNKPSIARVAERISVQ